MSRSFKHKPFIAITGSSSSQYDKTQAARGVRRRHRHELHIALIMEEFDVLLAHRRECSHNNTYSWCRDGKKHYRGLDAKDYQRYFEANNEGFGRFGIANFYYGDEEYTCWPPAWYQKMLRK